VRPQVGLDLDDAADALHAPDDMHEVHAERSWATSIVSRS
jgi:hypothetical protein